MSLYKYRTHGRSERTFYIVAPDVQSAIKGASETHPKDIVSKLEFVAGNVPVIGDNNG